MATNVNMHTYRLIMIVVSIIIVVVIIVIIVVYVVVVVNCFLHLVASLAYVEKVVLDCA